MLYHLRYPPHAYANKTHIHIVKTTSLSSLQYHPAYSSFCHGPHPIHTVAYTHWQRPFLLQRQRHQLVHQLALPTPCPTVLACRRHPNLSLRKEHYPVRTSLQARYSNPALHRVASGKLHHCLLLQYKRIPLHPQVLMRPSALRHHHSFPYPSQTITLLTRRTLLPSRVEWSAVWSYCCLPWH